MINSNSCKNIDSSNINIDRIDIQAKTPRTLQTQFKINSQRANSQAKRFLGTGDVFSSGRGNSKIKREIALVNHHFIQKTKSSAYLWVFIWYNNLKIIFY